MKSLLTCFLLLFSSIQIMSQHLGVYAKKGNELCFEKPIFTEQDSELANTLRAAESFLLGVKSSLDAPNEYLDKLDFSPEEIKALKCNFVQDNADGIIDYASSSGKAVPVDFYAIGVKCNEHHCFVYDAKYLEHENWSSIANLETALYKMIKAMHEKIKADQNVSDYFLYDYENLNMLWGIIKTLRGLYNPDEVALIIAP